MRNVYTPITGIRQKVFKEVAKLAFDGGDYSRLEALPYKIIPGEVASFRNNVFIERAIVGERLRLTIGLPLRPYTEHAPLSEGIEESAIDEKYYEPPLINIIKFACNSCPDKEVRASDMCRGCLAHPCTEVCPVDAVSIIEDKSYIDQDKCIKCGMCVTACPYNAIIKSNRPCSSACGVDAINSDELGRAEIDYDKCVSCGMCLVNCPFGAIADKSQILQTIIALKSDVKVYAAIAPAFVGQFGPNVTPEKLKAAMTKLGFEDTIEVAVGADLCTIEEAQDFVKNVPDNLPFMATSCCPSWSVMAKQLYPELAHTISMALTPMVITGRMIKRDHPDCKVVFIGPCSAKKLEASRKSVRSDIDFVLTFEELMGIFEAAEIDLNDLQDETLNYETSEDGRGYATHGGVAQAVYDCINKEYPDREVNIVSANGLADCRKMLTLAKAGKYDGYLLEGMACPGGCIAGAGTIQSIPKSKTAVTKYKQTAKFRDASDTEYREYLDLID